MTEIDVDTGEVERDRLLPLDGQVQYTLDDPVLVAARGPDDPDLLDLRRGATRGHAANRC